MRWRPVLSVGGHVVHRLRLEIPIDLPDDFRYLRQVRLDILVLEQELLDDLYIREVDVRGCPGVLGGLDPGIDAVMVTILAHDGLMRSVPHADHCTHLT